MLAGLALASRLASSMARWSAALPSSQAADHFKPCRHEEEEIFDLSNMTIVSSGSGCLVNHVAVVPSCLVVSFTSHQHQEAPRSRAARTRHRD